MFKFSSHKNVISKSISVDAGLRKRLADMKLANFSGFGGGGYGGSGGSGGSSGGGSGAGGGYNNNASRDSEVFNPVMAFLDQESVVNNWMSRSPERMHRIFDEIYLEDGVAGPAVDLYKDTPWSDFALTGVEDPAILKFYVDALNAINAVKLGPQITQQFLVQGKAIGLMVMDESKGYFTYCAVQNPDNFQVTPSPFPGFAPKIDLRQTAEMQNLLMSKDPRDVAVKQHLQRFASRLQKGQDMIPIEPSESFYIARQMTAFDSIGASIFTRILPYVAYERALINATLTTAHRRISRVRQVVMGKENWEPTPEEMVEIIDLFMDAERDPVGALIGTRDGVVVNEVGGNTLSDIIKMSDEGPYLTTVKLNALGVSETFLSGEASYNSMEQVLGVFLDRVRALRDYIVYNVHIDQILRPLAKKHKFLKQSKANLAHRIRIAQSDDISDYIIPTLVFDKKLTPAGDKDLMELLSSLEEKGFPITLRTWAAAASVDLQTELDQLPEDLKIRNTFAKHKAQVEALSAQGGDDSLGDAGDDEDLGGDDGFDLPEPDAGGGDEGGGEEPAAEEPEEPTDVEVGASSINVFKESAINKALSLPHLGASEEFLGVTKHVLAEKIISVADFIQGRKRKAMRLVDQKRLLSTGDENRDGVLSYLMCRSGILAGVKITPQVARAITPILCARISDPEVLAREITAVQEMTSLPIPMGPIVVQRTPARRMTKETMLLTGHIDPDTVKKMNTYIK